MAEVEGSVETLQNFAPIRPATFPMVDVALVSKRRKMLLLSNGSEFLYLLEEGKITVSNWTIRFVERAMQQHALLLLKHTQIRFSVFCA